MANPRTIQRPPGYNPFGGPPQPATPPPASYGAGVTTPGRPPSQAGPAYNPAARNQQLSPEITLSGTVNGIKCTIAQGDGRIYTGSSDNQVAVWHESSQTPERLLLGHKAPVLALIVLTDGRLVSASADRTLKLWDVRSGTLAGTFEGHLKPVLLVVDVGRGRIVSGSLDRRLKLWNVDTQACIATLIGHDAAISCIVHLGDGQVASGSDDGALRIWDTTHQVCTAVFKGHTRSITHILHGMNGHLITASVDRTLRLWHLAQEQCLRVFLGHTQPVTCLAMLPNANFASASDDGTVRIWKVDSNQPLRSFTPHYGGGPVSTLYVLDKDHIVTSSIVDYDVVITDVSSGSCTAKLPGRNVMITNICVSGNGSIITISENAMRVWRLDKPSMCLVLQAIRSCNHNQALVDMVIGAYPALLPAHVLAIANLDLLCIAGNWQDWRALPDVAEWVQVWAAQQYGIADPLALLLKQPIPFEQVATLHLFGDATVRRLILLPNWPKSCKDAWIAASGCGIPVTVKIPNASLITVGDSRQSGTAASSAAGSAAAGDIELPLRLKFSNSHATMHVELTDSDTAIVFRGQESGFAYAQPPLCHPNKYNLSVLLQPSGAGTIHFLLGSDITLCFVFSVALDAVTVQLTVRGSPVNAAEGTTVRLQQCQSHVDLILDLKNGTFTLLNAATSSVIFTTPLHFPDGACPLGVATSMRDARVAIKRASWIEAATSTDDAKSTDPWMEVADPASGNRYYFNPVTGQTAWNRPSPSDATDTKSALPDDNTASDVDDRVDHTRHLAAQAALLWSLARLSPHNAQLFATPGNNSLDTTIAELLTVCHPQVVQVPWTDGTDLLTVFARNKLVGALQATAEQSGIPLLVPMAPGDPCLLGELEQNDRAFAAQLVDSWLADLGVVSSAFSCEFNFDRWEAWTAAHQARRMDLFVDSQDEIDRQLFVALAFLSLDDKSLVQYADDALHAYLATVQLPSRLVLLYQTRQAQAAGKHVDALAALKSYVLLGWKHRLSAAAGDNPVLPGYYLSPAECQRLLAPAKAVRHAQSPTPLAAPSTGGLEESKSPPTASQQWADAKAKTTSLQSAAMDELIGLIGMEEVKIKAVQVFLVMEAWAAMEPRARAPVSLNFAFMGNPGTGKTTVARLFGKLLFEAKARRTQVFIERSAVQLKREGGKAFAELVKQALGGVLFIDEAYQLEPAKDPVGRDIVDELLAAAENHRNDLTIILAGYKDDIQKHLFSYNTGLGSRFADVTFCDFNDGQLGEIWAKFLQDHAWTVEEPNVSNVAVRRVARQRNTKGFGNARSVRSAFETAIKTAATRWSSNRSATKQCITMDDVIGPPPSRDTLPELDEALRQLDALSGLQKVKDAIKQLVANAVQNHRREVRGQPILPIALNRLMLGNPGTGKTTVAAIYAQVLKSLGLVTKGSVELKTASDFVGSVVGESAEKTRTILELCRGKVLVIDEAYNLNDNLYGKQVIDTIVEKVMGAPGEDIAVLLLGYEKEMRDMLREQNPGLARRFNPEHALMFQDYDDVALALIAAKICETEQLRLPRPVLGALVRTLSQQRAMPNFGNAGAVRNLLSVAKSRMMARLNGTGSDDTTLIVADIVGEGRTAQGATEGDPLAPIRKLFAAEHIVEELSLLQKTITVQRREGKDVRGVGGNWLFLGNPGTGKTTVAKCMGQMLYDLGVIARNAVEITSAADLTGNVVGEAKGLVAEAMGRARGGVLFIDEAYELGLGAYGQEAQTKVVELMTSDDFRIGTVVILAGYDDAMQEMLSRNVGLKSRFQKTLNFPDWSANDCTGFVMQQMLDDSFTVDATSVRPALLHAFKELIARPGWANARDAISAWRDRISQARCHRVFDAPEAKQTILLEDVQRGMEAFLIARPCGPTRRQQDIGEAFASLAQRQTHRTPAVQAERSQGAVQVQDITEGVDESKADAITEEDLIRFQRAAEEAQRQEDARLAELRAAEEAARQAAEEAQRRADAAAAQAAAQAAEKARREAEAIQKEQRRQQKLRELGRCPQSYRWNPTGNGWYRCQGGSHTIHVKDLD